MGLNLGSGALDALDVRLGSVTPPAVYHGSDLVWPLTEATWDGGFESIATITVGAGGASSIEFVDIPQTFSHLQVRFVARSDMSGYNNDPVTVRFNSDTGSNYAYHSLYGTGAAAGAEAASSETYGRAGSVPGANISASMFGVGVIDILDYASTSKATTVRSFVGFDNNSTAGLARLNSSLWSSTNAVTTMELGLRTSSGNFAQYSRASLYGIGKVV